MSLVLAANHLASHGRHGDTELIHMSKGEVKALRGLAQIHGGDLTINPKTGLPEAGFLSSILPTVLGVAGAAMGIPTPLLIGGIGLATAAITGDLGQGLMAGLGAWSGQQLGADIAKVGASTAQNMAPQAGSAAFEASKNYINPALVTNAAGTGISTSLTPGVGALADTTIGPGASIGNFTNAYAAPGAGLSGTGFKPMDVVQQNTAAEAQNVANKVNETIGSSQNAAPWYSSDAIKGNTSQFGRGWDKITSSPTEAWNFVKENPWHTFAAAYPAIDYALTPKANKPPAPEDQNPFGFKKLSKDFKGTFGIRPSPYPSAQYVDYTKTPYIPGTMSSAGGGLQTAHFANKGLVNFGLGLLDSSYKPAPITATDPGAAYSPAYNALGISPYEKDTENMSSDKMAQSILKQAKSLGKMASRASVMMPDPAKTAMASIQNDSSQTSAKEGGLQGYALGGLSMGNLGGYSDGGRLLKGPGDGVSDSIPASIGHKQPARLAEGEFVIPARIVSELGNGSTDAGAKRLYAMMDRIKAKRAKTKNIAADTKTYNYLPA